MQKLPFYHIRIEKQIMLGMVNLIVNWLIDHLLDALPWPLENALSVPRYS